MKMRGRKLLIAGALVLTAALSGGCGRSKEETELRKTAIEQMDAGNFEEAISTFDLALKEADGKVGEMELDILKYRGEAEYKFGDYDAAAHTWDVLLQVDKEQPEYLYARSMAYSGAGKVSEALADYEKASEMEKKMNRNVAGKSDALIAVGKACMAAGDSDQASALYENALKDGSIGDSAEVYNTLAMARMEDGMYEEALSFLEAGIRTGEEAVMPDLLFNQGVAYEYLSDFKRALEIFEQYELAYGPSEEAQKEIAFLKTR